MGDIKAEWCFRPIDEKSHEPKFCATSKVDTGAVAIVLPEHEARRLGVPLEVLGQKMPAPKDASGRAVDGEWFMVGGASSSQHKCKLDELMVFGQRGRKQPLIGNGPLQGADALIMLSDKRGDTMRCLRQPAAKRVVKSPRGRR